MSNTKKIIAVVGATGQQGGAVIRALKEDGQFRVRALTRDPAKHPNLADEVVLADLNRPETLNAAFAGAYGVFLVTDAWQAHEDEPKQASAAIKAAKWAGVKHFVWSTLPNVETLSRGKLQVPHFTLKAKVDSQVAQAGFDYHTFVIAPFFYQNLVGAMAPQKQADGTLGWALPLDPARRVIHAGDITELGRIVVGAFSQPALAGHGEYLPLVGDLLSFNEILATLNAHGNKFSFQRVPRGVFATFFPGAEDVAAMLAYFEAHTYLGSDLSKEIALARKVAGRQPTKFAIWAKGNFATPIAA